MDTLRQDLRHAFTTMRRAPAFTATALITLALGIGASTAVFSIVHGVLLRPLPYPQADRLVRLWQEHPGGASAAGNRWLGRSTYALWRGTSSTLDAVGGYSSYDYTVVFDREPMKMFGSQVSPAVFSMLGVTPARGRFFTNDEDREGAERVVVISDEVWRERYASNPHVVGTSFSIEGNAHTVVGVAPPGLQFPDARVRYWIPYVIPRSAVETAGTVVFTALGRMKTGATLAQVEAEGTATARGAPRHRLTELFFGKGGPPVVHARRLVDDMTVTVRPALSVMAVAVALVLLIACANVANLLLSRGVARRRELAIRAAIGGSRARLLRQLITESAMLAMAGGALGLGLAWWLVRALPAIAPARLPRLEDVGLDLTVVAFCVLATAVAALASGVAPAWRGARVDLYDAFRGADGSSSSGFRGAGGRRLRDSLLVVEAAFAVILIVGAGLLTHSFIRLLRVDAGYTADRVLTARVELPEGSTDAQTDQFIDAVLARLRGMPGVSSAGAAGMIPLMSRSAIVPFRLPSHIAGNKPVQGRALIYWITPGYAEVLGLRLREGRFFVDADARAGRLATIVNQEFVRKHLSTSHVTGLTIPGLVGEERGTTSEIIGVVGDVLKDGNDRAPQPELYFVHGSPGQRIAGQVNLVVRTIGDPDALAPLLGRLVRQIESGAVVDPIEPLTTAVATSVAQPRFAATVVVAFASLAMILAAVGLYGVLSYSVSQRHRELGIRAALGAGRADLVRLVLREGLTVTLMGVALGLVAAMGLTRLLQQLLFGVAPIDAVAFTVAPVVLVAAAIAASVGPALRAASTDPATTLRGGS